MNFTWKADNNINLVKAEEAFYIDDVSDKSEDQALIADIFLIGNGDDLKVPDEKYDGPPGPGVDLDGTFGDDVLSGTREDDTINGGSGGRDHIFGYGGDDSLSATNNSFDAEGDYVYGGSGHDQINGSDSGDDHLFGGTGNDTIYGGEDKAVNTGNSDDSIYGHDGNDTILAGGGSDTVEGGNGADNINGGNSNDFLYGNAGGDIIDGGYGEDLIRGGDGNDTLFGGMWSDEIYGGNGDDILQGAFHAEEGEESISLAQFDWLIGGAGADRFVLGDDDGTFYLGEKWGGSNGYADIKDFSQSQGDVLIVFGSASDYEFNFVDDVTDINYNGDLIARVNGLIDPATDVMGLGS